MTIQISRAADVHHLHHLSAEVVHQRSEKLSRNFKALLRAGPKCTTCTTFFPKHIYVENMSLLQLWTHIPIGICFRRFRWCRWCTIADIVDFIGSFVHHLPRKVVHLLTGRTRERTTPPATAAAGIRASVAMTLHVESSERAMSP